MTLSLPGLAVGSAEFSPCGRHRYTLTRKRGALFDARRCTFVMLNPSTADADTDDPTIARCRTFAVRWGYDVLYVVNLFSWRATDPRAMFATWREGELLIDGGPENLHAIEGCARSSHMVIAAWGGPYQPAALQRLVAERARFVRRRLAELRVTLHVLALTKDGHPRHPLYLRGDLVPHRWEVRS